MQTVSGALATALTSQERTIVVRVKADWGRDGTFSYDPGVFRDVFSDTFEGIGDIGDLSPFVESVSVDRSLSTDLPDAARLNAGFGAAEASVTLAGLLDAGMPLTQVLSAHTGSASLLRRVTTPIYVELGAVGASGPEYVRQFTGRIRSVGVDPGGRSVTLSALDGREKLSKPVALPVTVNVGSNYFMDFIAASNGVTLTYVESVQNTGLSTPTVDASDPWELLQQIVSAEQGVIQFDENDNLKFYNRNHMSGGSAVATVTTDPVTFANLKSVTSEESTDSVRNYVTVGAAPLELDAVGTVIWSLAEVRGVIANSVLRIPVEFPGSLYTVTALNYQAAKLANGTGGDVANLIVDFAVTGTTTGTVVVVNPNAFDVFLVFNSTSPTVQGQPALTISGRCLRPALESGYIAISQDPPSQIAYGVQPLDVGSNVWRQAGAVAVGLADYLLAALKEPHPTLSGVDIVGDPRLQLADRVRVVEPDGLALDGDFWLTAITTRFSSSDGLSQSVTLRSA